MRKECNNIFFTLRNTEESLLTSTKTTYVLASPLHQTGQPVADTLKDILHHVLVVGILQQLKHLSHGGLIVKGSLRYELTPSSLSILLRVTIVNVVYLAHVTRG